jgi:uncharacterized protein
MHPLDKLDHRPWPLPQVPWIMEQVWRDLLFTHWDFPADIIRPLVPPSLQIDTFEGRAWVSVIPFQMSIRPRGLPGRSRVIELNCRTYVVAEEKPGIYFFSLDTDSRVAVLGARLFYSLPYYHADMVVATQGEVISYCSRRNDARWRGVYAPQSPPCAAAPGSLNHWLTERYCLYTVRHGRTYRGNVHHVPWSLQEASVEIYENTVFEHSEKPLLVPRATLRIRKNCVF